MSKSICLYLHVHQPFRVRHYTIFDAGRDHQYFNDSVPHADTNNEFIIKKVAEKSYLPTNRRLLDLLHRHSEFKLSLSLTGTVLEQLEAWAPEALRSFQELAETGRVEIAGETYHHTLAYFYDKDEFEAQVKMHEDKIEQLFDQKPAIFRGTELSYNNEIAQWAEAAGYKGILAEGWDPVLGWRSPNFVYRPLHSNSLRLLMKNYKLSDDIAFRFSDRNWSEWPLTTEKFVHWINSIDDAQVINLFMDYETFGEHQWEDAGIFDFLEQFPSEFLKFDGNHFVTLSEAIEKFEPVDEVDVPNTVTWADTERDLSAWLGNNMQQQAINAIYNLRERILATDDLDLIEDWRKLQSSDHFYYMCTKWFNDGDIHAYFSPYQTPYEAFIAYMNTIHDLKFRLSEKAT